ncbi:hypothetical protein HD806DRAFT_62914 [Xylariaceae sp. AK1471]|nr:hypothetical protein HD806DRAFT_62914 [Xylariaceae sp. AK1471]
MHPTLRTAAVVLLALALPVHGVRFRSCGTADVTFYSDVDCKEDSKVPDPGMDDVPGGVCYEPGAMVSILKSFIPLLICLGSINRLFVDSLLLRFLHTPETLPG